MTQMVEFDLAKILERMEEKLNKVVESQARLEGKIDKLEVKLEGKIDTLEVEIKNLKTVQDATNAKLNNQQTWFLTLLTGLTVGILGLVTTIGKVVFFPNP